MSMLPEEEVTTRGHWRIEGNRFFCKADVEPGDAHAYTILLLTKDNFIFTEGETVFDVERIRDDANQDGERGLNALSDNSLGDFMPLIVMARWSAKILGGLVWSWVFSKSGRN